MKKETCPDGVRQILWDDWLRACKKVRKEFPSSSVLAREYEWGFIYMKLEGNDYRVTFIPNSKKFYFMEKETGIGVLISGKLSRSRQKIYKGTPVLDDMKELQTLVDQVSISFIMAS